MSSHSSDHPQEVLLAQFSLYVHKGGLNPHSFHVYSQRRLNLKSVLEIGLGVTLCYNVETIFFLVNQGLRPKKNVVSVATSCVFRL